MPRFVDQSETKVIQADWWAEKETATIRRFSYGDRQFLAGEMLKMEVSADGSGEGEAITDVVLGRMNLAILERGLVAWTDEEGNPLPITRKAIEGLEERDGEFILAEINALNPSRRRTSEEQEFFRRTDRNSFTDKQPSSDGTN